jgi:hypothetical protein
MTAHRVLERVLDRHALLRVLLQEALDERLGLRAVALPVCARLASERSKEIRDARVHRRGYGMARSSVSWASASGVWPTSGERPAQRVSV